MKAAAMEARIAALGIPAEATKVAPPKTEKIVDDIPF
jgi:hypothetical protein